MLKHIHPSQLFIKNIHIHRVYLKVRETFKGLVVDLKSYKLFKISYSKDKQELRLFFFRTLI